MTFLASQLKLVAYTSITFVSLHRMSKLRYFLMVGGTNRLSVALGRLSFDWQRTLLITSLEALFRDLGFR